MYDTLARIAQSVEQQTENLRVAGSIPASGTIYHLLFSKWFFHRGVVQLVERRSPKPNVEGSSPFAPAIIKVCRYFVYRLFCCVETRTI